MAATRQHFAPQLPLISTHSEEETAKNAIFLEKQLYGAVTKGLCLPCTGEALIHSTALSSSGQQHSILQGFGQPEMSPKSERSNLKAEGAGAAGDTAAAGTRSAVHYFTTTRS